MNWQSLTLAFSCLATVPAASAESLEEVQVVASRLAVVPARAVHDVMTLPATVLQRYPDLATAVSSLAGAHVQRPGGRSGIATLYLDGADPNFTTVMLDGVALNNPTDTRGGAVNLSGIEAGTFSRAELVSGPFSSIHGSGALAGALNLVVPAGLAESRWNGTLEAGEQGFGHAALQLRMPLAAGIGAGFAADVADDGAGPGGSRFRTEAFTLKFAPLDSDGRDAGSLLLRTRIAQGAGFPDASGGDRYAALRTLEQRRNRQSLGSALLPFPLAPNALVQLRASWLQEASETLAPGVSPSLADPFGLPAGDDRTRYDRRSLQAQVRLGEGHRQLVLGAEQQGEQGSSEGALDFGGFRLPSQFIITRHTTAAYAEALHSGERWGISASARLDKVEGLPGQLTASGALRHHLPAAGLTLRLSAGSAFKAPSLYALGNPFVGNPQLRSESARSWRAAAEWSGAQGSEARLTIFRTEYSGLIDFVPGPPPRLENRDAVLSRGASLRLAQSLGDNWSATAFFQLTSTFDRNGGARLLDRPGTRAGSGLEWRPHERLSASLQYLYLGARRSYSIPTGEQRLGGVADLAAHLQWQASERHALRLSMDNALDGAGEHAVGFTAPGRRLRIAFTGAL